MPEPRPRGYEDTSPDAFGVRPYEEPLDDWLGDVSDEDWSENATGRAGRRRTPADETVPVADGNLGPDPGADRPVPARADATAEGHRAVVERRRLVAGLVIVVLVGLGAATAVLLLRGGDQTAVTPVTEPTITTPAPVETNPSAAPTTPSPSPSTPTTTTPSAGGDPAFTLPEGTKLQLGEAGDPAVIRELQQALTRAGYDPGPADGTFGPQTEAAVTAFQEANGLSVDGRVGPETASALNSVLEDG